MLVSWQVKDKKRVLGLCWLGSKVSSLNAYDCPAALVDDVSAPAVPALARPSTGGQVYRLQGSPQHNTYSKTDMPPKGSTKRKESPVEEPRRSTRGGGHKAPEPKAVKPRSKKAKVDKEEATANGNSEEKKDETAAAPAAVEEEKKEEPAKNGDASSELKETAKHNEAEVEKADSKRIEVGEQVPEGEEGAYLAIG